MPLQSSLFRDDPALNACLERDPAHVTPGARGEHVGKIQQALELLVPGLSLPDAEKNAMVYGPSTATAVLQYKTNHVPPIINPAIQTRPDNIVGRMTIRALDDDMLALENRPPPEPVPSVKTQTLEVTIKSFIAVIGAKVGTMPGMTVVPVPIPPFTVVLEPVPRQALLETLAKATDAAFSEDPVTVAKDKHYRLFSSCNFTLSWSDGNLLGATASALETDGGEEAGMQTEPLIATPVTTGSAGPSTFTFSWSAKGRPLPIVEPVFQTVQPRTSVYIWHTIFGQIDVSSGAPVLTGILHGSEFPSHRVFVDGKLTVAPPELRQGVFSSLWVPDPSDPTKVK